MYKPGHLPITKRSKITRKTSGKHQEKREEKETKEQREEEERKEQREEKEETAEVRLGKVEGHPKEKRELEPARPTKKKEV